MAVQFLMTFLACYAAAYCLYLTQRGDVIDHAATKSIAVSHRRFIQLGGLVCWIIAVSVCVSNLGWERGIFTAVFITALSGPALLALANFVSFRSGFNVALLALGSALLLRLLHSML